MMAYAQVNGRDVIAGHISCPVAGAWRATLTVDADSSVTFAGQVALTLGSGDETWTATVVRSADAFGRAVMMLVGGMGGLAKQLPGGSYRSVPARVPVSDIMALSGESLSAKSDRSLLSTTLPYWSRASGQASTQLGSVLDSIGATWRVLTDGTLWIGIDAWPAAETVEYEVAAMRPEESSVVIASMYGYKILPGQTLAGQRVSYIEHAISDKGLRSTIWYQL